MKRLPIKARVTLWYAALLMALCVLLFIILMTAADMTARTYHQQKLEDATAFVLEELSEDDGDLEIDSDIHDIPNVYASLFETDGRLIYGNARVDLPFEEGTLRRAQTATHSWYVLDTLITFEKRGDVWLRMYTSADASWNAMRAVLRYGFWLFPALMVVALVGGYVLTARAFSPVKEMTRLAASIAGGEDLSRRIGMTGSRDELCALAGVMDAMLERLEHSFARERRFTADVAHELRTPLHAVATQCEYALSRPEREEKDEALRKILQKNGEMTALIGQLLMLARVESGQMPQEDACSLSEMVAEIAQDMEPVAAEKGMRIQTQLCSFTMKGNRALLARAFINLVDNAIRYGREGGTLRIAMRRGEEGVCLRFEDDGRGIAQQDLSMIFERFWRADRSRATQGTGIGLSIVKSVVKAHAGTLSVTSELGKGTCFTLCFPKGEEENSRTP
ncbi:MAG TPA: HAMP domain-containing protein [Candidatus Ventricola intestinavium]|nr:HAMP domain-containing protein [Candidatus Ventricola intestinavium]